MNSETEYTTLEPAGEFAASIRDFRSAVTHFADRETAQPVPANWLAPARKRRRHAQQRMVLGWAAAALLCFATLPLSMHSRHAVIPGAISSAIPGAIPGAIAPAVAIAAAPAADTDSALLEQVDTEVSRSVPASLAPLTELDSTGLDSLNKTSSTTSSDSSNGALTQTETNDVAH
jgi:hypothetical protein